MFSPHDSFLLVLQQPERSPLFPYTTLFRSWQEIWERERTWEVPNDPENADHREKSYVLEMLPYPSGERSEEHTSELQSRQYLVCRLLLEKKKFASSEDIRYLVFRGY